jgi:membrane protein
MGFKSFWILIKETIDGWVQDNVMRLAAALAFYTIFSLAPLLIIVVGLIDIVISQMHALEFGLTIDRAGVVDRIALEVQDLIGPRGEALVRTIFEDPENVETGIWATIVGLITLLVGATGVFAELQAALNKVWKVEPPAINGIISVVRARVLSFAMILVIGFLLLVSLLISVILSALSEYLGARVPEMLYFMRVISFALSILITTILFAFIYRYLPDAHIAWRDVWIGALVTSLLFTSGKTLIGLYLGNAPFGAAYGAASSLAIILVWVFFSAQIVLLGAEFTEVYSRRYGSRILSYAEVKELADRPPEPPASSGSVANF